MFGSLNEDKDKRPNYGEFILGKTADALVAVGNAIHDNLKPTDKESKPLMPLSPEFKKSMEEYKNKLINLKSIVVEDSKITEQELVDTIEKLIVNYKEIIDRLTIILENNPNVKRIIHELLSIGIYALQDALTLAVGTIPTLLIETPIVGQIYGLCLESLKVMKYGLSVLIKFFEIINVTGDNIEFLKQISDSFDIIDNVDSAKSSFNSIKEIKHIGGKKRILKMHDALMISGSLSASTLQESKIPAHKIGHTAKVKLMRKKIRRTIRKMNCL